LAVAASIGLVAFANIEAAATTMGKREFTCPIGGKTFTALVVNSNTYWGRRLDLKPIAPTPSSVPWPLPVCPDNGFVMFKRHFSEAELGTLTPIVLSDEYQKLRTQNTAYFMLAYLQARTGADDEKLANLYLTASWEAESTRPEVVGRYRALALEKFQAVLGRDRIWAVVLLAGELERLLGRFDAAEARLAAVPAEALDANQSKWLEQIRKHVRSRNSEAQEFVYGKRPN
jgi:hypothetical protein